MRKIFIALFGIFLIAGITNPASADITTITFETGFSGDGHKLPSDYAGLSWSSGWNWWMPGSSSGWTSSGDYSADPYNNILEINFGQKVTFLGSWVYQYSGKAYWEGWSGGTRTDISKSITDGAGWIDVNWSNVDKVKFIANNSGLNSIDDIKYETTPPPVIPEPISSVLFIAGGAVLAGRRYFKRRK